MVRVLQVVTHMNRGGLETMIMNYYRNIDRQTIQFDFLVHRDGKADYDEEIEQLGGKIYHISKLIPWSSFYKNELKHFFEEHPEYKIIHVHQDCLSSVILKAAKQNGIQVRIAHSHNASQDKNFKYPIKLFYKRKIPVYATNLFACGKEAGEWMFRGCEFSILNNAIDTRIYEPSECVREKARKEFGLGEELVIGHVGRFSPAKNHTFLADIFYEILKIEPNAKMMLVGRGEGEEEIKKKLKTLGIENRVIFTGLRSDVHELMQAMDIFVFPSLYEGLPVTMVEAQAAGLPCIISDKVPKECIMTQNLVKVMSLSCKASEWAYCVLEAGAGKRVSHSDEIKRCGYDIRTNAKELQEYYLEKIKEIG